MEPIDHPNLGGQGSTSPVPPSPSSNKERVLQKLSDLNIHFQEHQTPSFRTMEICRELRDNLIQGIFCKNLFVRDKKQQYFLICAEETSPVDLKALRKELSASRCLTFASEGELVEILGVPAGAVSPLALLNCSLQVLSSITVVLDAKIMAASLANFHPSDPLSTITLEPKDLMVFLESLGLKSVVHSFQEQKEPSSKED